MAMLKGTRVRRGVLINGDVLRGMRRRRLLSQEALAIEAGLSASTMRQIETQKDRRVDFETIIKLADALDTDTDMLIISENAELHRYVCDCHSCDHHWTSHLREGAPPRCPKCQATLVSSVPLEIFNRKDL